MRALTSATRVVALFGSILLLLACSNGKSGPGPKTGPQPGDAQLDRSRCDTKGKRVVKLDLNRDEQADVWNIYTQREERGTSVDVLACKSIDLNFDGRTDMWKYYDDTGSLTREEMDLDFDGRIDIITFRQAGKVMRQELDTNYDGKTDIWKHFEQEALARVDRDSNNDGKVDYWEYYEGGQLDRIGYDNDGDGRVDHWDRAPSRAEAPEAKPPAEETGGEEKKEE